MSRSRLYRRDEDVGCLDSAALVEDEGWKFAGEVVAMEDVWLEHAMGRARL